MSVLDNLKNNVGVFSEYILTSKLANHQLVWYSQDQKTLFEPNIVEHKIFSLLDINQLI